MIRCGYHAFEIFNLVTNATIFRVNDTNNDGQYFYDCKFSSQGDYAVTFGRRRVDVYNSSNVKIYELKDDSYNSFSIKIDWNSNGNQLIFGFYNATTTVRGLYVWNKLTNTTSLFYNYATYSTTNRIFSLDWSPNDQVIAFHI